MMKRRRSAMLVGLAMATALAMAVPATAAADSSAACFGRFVASNAHNPPFGASNLGQVVRGLAHSTQPFGRNGIPLFKSLACG